MPSQLDIRAQYSESAALGSPRVDMIIAETITPTEWEQLRLDASPTTTTIALTAQFTGTITIIAQNHGSVPVDLTTSDIGSGDGSVRIPAEGGVVMLPGVDAGNNGSVVAVGGTSLVDILVIQ